MNEQEYLNQISSSIRPEKVPKASGVSGIFSSIYFKIGIGALVALILIMIIGSLLGGGSNKDIKVKLATLELRLEGTSEVISEYQEFIKSSDLRSTCAALGSVLSNTAMSIETYLDEQYDYSTRSLSKDVTELAEYDKAVLDNDLFEAKINGLLDRIFVHKMDYEISTLMNEEVSINSSAKDTKVQELLESSYSSLSTLYDKINGFSETK